MAKKKEAPDYSTFEPYQYAALAAQLMETEEGLRLVPSALENLVGPKGLKVPKDALEVMKTFGTFNLINEEGKVDQTSFERIKRGVTAYASKFEKERGKLSPADLLGWYAPLLSGLSDDEKKKIADYFEAYQESSEKIRTSVAKALHTLKTPGGASAEERTKAEKTVKKYANVVGALEIFDKYRFEDLRGTTEKATRTKELKDLASKLN